MIAKALALILLVLAAPSALTANTGNIDYVETDSFKNKSVNRNAIEESAIPYRYDGLYTGVKIKDWSESLGLKVAPLYTIGWQKASPYKEDWFIEISSSLSAVETKENTAFILSDLNETVLLFKLSILEIAAGGKYYLGKNQDWVTSLEGGLVFAYHGKSNVMGYRFGLGFGKSFALTQRIRIEPTLSASYLLFTSGSLDGSRARLEPSISQFDLTYGATLHF